MLFPKPHGIPVFVMLPLDTVNGDGVFKYAGSPWFAQSLHLLASSGAYGVAVDVWWGAVEREPGQYVWHGYRQLFELIRQTGLKLQVVFSFHACGGNVGDTAHVPLPTWVQRCGEIDPDLFFTDRPRAGSSGQRNREYLSFWADDAQSLCGRSPMQCYEDFMASFNYHFLQELGSLIEEIVVGAGPCGELRFPSYVEANGWRFPGVGEFQCYDRRALASLAQAAQALGQPGWGYGGPHDTGNYNSNPEDTGFYHHGGSWDTDYGRFFLEWYSGSLLKHGDRIMGAARRVFGPARSRTPPKSSSVPSSEASTDTRTASPLTQPQALFARQQGQQEQQHHAQSDGGGGGASRVHLLASETIEEEHSDASMSLMLEQGMDGMLRSERTTGEAHNTSASIAAGPSGMAAGCNHGMAAAAASPRPLFSRRSEGDGMPAPSAVPANIERPSTVDRTCSTVFMFNNSQCSIMDTSSLGRDIADDASESMTTDRSGDNLSAAAADDMLAGPVGDLEQQHHAGEAGGGAAQQHGGRELTLTLKIAGIHWWFRSRSHAAELTAGYYNTATRDGYGAIVDLCAKHRFGLTLTCVEMCDTQHPPPALCGPEGLLKQVRSLCAHRGVPLSGENALPIFLMDSVDSTALDRIVYNTRVWHGAAIMAAYWSTGQSLARSLPAQAVAPHGPGRPLGSDYHGSSTGPMMGGLMGGLIYHGSGTNLVVLASPGHRGSENGNVYAAAGSRPGSTSGRQRHLCPARSDPAIAATGLRADSYADISEPLPPMRSFTFLRLASQILQPSYQGPWMKFMWKMREGGFC